MIYGKGRIQEPGARIQKVGTLPSIRCRLTSSAFLRAESDAQLARGSQSPPFKGRFRGIFRKDQHTRKSPLRPFGKGGDWRKWTSPCSHILTAGNSK